MDEIARLMATLKISEEEARELAGADAEIDKGKDLFPLTPEQRKAEKAMRGTGTRKRTAYDFQKRERKADADKRKLMEILTVALCENADGHTVEITNPERQIDFCFHNRKFRIVLSAPRS